MLGLGNGATKQPANTCGSLHGRPDFANFPNQRQHRFRAWACIGPTACECCNRLKEYTPYSKYQLFWLTENRPPVVFIPFPRDLTDQGLHVTENRSSLAYPAHKGNLLYSKNNKTTFNINPNRADKRSQNRLLANSKTM